MMKIASFRKKSDPVDNRFCISGEINERMPMIRDGIIAHFPFDGNTDNYLFDSGTPLYVPILEYITFKEDGSGAIIERYVDNGTVYNGKLEYSIGSDLFKDGSNNSIGTIILWGAFSGSESIINKRGFLEAVDGAGQKKMHLYINADNIVKAAMDTTILSDSAALTWSDGSSHLIALTFDENQNNVVLYVDGQKKSEMEFITSGDWSRLIIGKQDPSDEDNYAANLVLKDLGLFNRALTEAEISIMYNNMFQLTEDGDLVIREFIELPDSELDSAPEISSKRGAVTIAGELEEEYVFL